MKINKLVFCLFLIFWISSICYSQLEINPSVLNEINNNSITDIDFDKYNSLNLADIERQAYLIFLQKEYEKAAKYYLFLFKNNVDDAYICYNLSCCYARLNYPELAGYFLILSINNGFKDFSKIKNEESFKLIRENQYFANVFSEVEQFGNKLDKTIYAEAKVFVKSKVILPENFDSNKKYKLLIGLHGYGGNAEYFSSIHTLVDAKNYILVFPEAPYLKSNEGGNRYLGFSWDFKGNDNELWKKSDPEVVNYIINVVDYLNSIYPIEKTYILGFSQGVAYAYSSGIKNPDKIDGIIAFGGRLPDDYPWFISEQDLKNGNSVKIFIAHGKDDNAVSYKQSISAKKKLEKFNYNVELKLFNGGHTVPQEPLNEALKWLDLQEKK